MGSIPGQLTEDLLRAGADAASVRWSRTDKQELNVEWDEVSLLRSTHEQNLQLVALADGKRGMLRANDLTPDATKRSIEDVIEMARSSRADDANAVAEGGAPARFESGPAEADLDAMHDRLVEFLRWRKQAHPKLSLRQVHFHFQRTEEQLENSRGVDLQASVGSYTFVAVFSSKEGTDTSSFNYSVWEGRDLDRPMSERGSFDRLFGQSADQLQTEQIADKFVGDVIVTPDCLSSFLQPITNYLRDVSVISGTSVYQDSVGAAIASPQLTVHACPRSAAAPRFFTQDGYVAEDAALIEGGTLRSFLLSLYGSNKTGLPRAANDGGCYTVAPGTRTLDEMIASVQRGVLLCRFSGGRPSENGDFSGIAKNSYRIEDGKIRAPLSETMISGNLVKMLHQIASVSKEQVDFGSDRYPWISFGGLTVS